MKKFKKVLNGFIALCVANIPSIFPEASVILTIYIIGLITIFFLVFWLLNVINK